MYCTLQDAQSLIKSFVITNSTAVTTDEVNDDIIPEVSRRIDERLGKYYVTPITGTNALITLNRIAKWYAAAEVMDRIYLGQAPSASPQSASWRGLADKDLQRIVDGDIILTDATPTGDTPEPISQKISSNLTSASYPNPPVFDMGKVF